MTAAKKTQLSTIQEVGGRTYTQTEVNDITEEYDAQIDSLNLQNVELTL